MTEKVCADPSLAVPGGSLNMGGMELECETAAAMLMATFTASKETCAEIPELIKNMGQSITYEQLASVAAPACCAGTRSACDPRIFDPPSQKYGGKRGNNPMLCWPPEAAAPAGTTFQMGDMTIVCDDVSKEAPEGWKASTEMCAINMDGQDMPISFGMGMAALEPVCCPYCTNVCNAMVLAGDHPGCDDDGVMKGGAPDKAPTEAPTKAPTSAPAPAPTTKSSPTPAPAPAAKAIMTHTGDIKLDIPGSMVDKLVESPTKAKKIMEAALKKNMGVDTVTVTGIKVDGVALDLSRRLSSHTTPKEVTCTYEVTAQLSKADVESWGEKAKGDFPAALEMEASKEGITLAKIEVKSNAVTKSATVSVPAPPPAGGTGTEASAAWRQAIPSCVGLAALIRAMVM